MRYSGMNKFFNFGVLWAIKKRLRVQTFFLRYFKTKVKRDFFPYFNLNLRRQDHSVVSTLAVNHRYFDARLLQNRFSLLSPIKKTASIWWFLVFGFICFLAAAFILVVLIFEGIYPAAHLLLTNTSLLLGQEFFANLYIFDYLEFCTELFIIKWVLLFCQDFFTKIHFVFTSVVYFLAYAWETWVEIAAAKYLVERPLFEILWMFGNQFYAWVCVLLLVLIVLQFVLINLLLKLYVTISDNWEFLVNFSQPLDWDLFFFNTTQTTQFTPLNLYDLKARRAPLTTFLNFYKAGYVENEFNFFNTLNNLLRMSRITFLGYRGFLNLFPSNSVILDSTRFVKKKLLQPSFGLFFSRNYAFLDSAKGLIRLLTRAQPLATNSIRQEISKFSFLPKLSYVSKNNINDGGQNLFFGGIWRLWGLSSLENLALDKLVVRKAMSTFSYTKWYLAFSESDESDLTSPAYSFNSEDGIFNWYKHELDLIVLTATFKDAFRKKQLFNFNFGKVNLVGDNAFALLTPNYHARFEHDYPDEAAPFFESEDSIQKLSQTRFDTVTPADEEEFVEEDDIEYSGEFWFEDGFLHSDIEVWGWSEGEDFDDLMLDDALLSSKAHYRAADFKLFDIELDEVREDMFDIFASSQWGFRNYNFLTTSSAYKGDAELEFGDTVMYQERVFDTLYDDLADFLWLNSFERGLSSWFTFSRSRFLYAEGVSSTWKRLFRKFRLAYGRGLYATPELATQTFFLKSYYLKFILGYAVLALVGLGYATAALSTQWVYATITYSLWDFSFFWGLVVYFLFVVIFIHLMLISNWRVFIFDKLLYHAKTRVAVFFFGILFFVSRRAGVSTQNFLNPTRFKPNFALNKFVRQPINFKFFASALSSGAYYDLAQRAMHANLLLVDNSLLRCLNVESVFVEQISNKAASSSHSFMSLTAKSFLLKLSYQATCVRLKPAIFLANYSADAAKNLVLNWTLSGSIQERSGWGLYSKLTLKSERGRVMPSWGEFLNTASPPLNVFSRFYLSGNPVFLPKFSIRSEDVNVGKRLTIFENFMRSTQTASRAKIKYLEPKLPLVKNQYRLTQFARFFLSQDLLDRIYTEQTSQSKSVYKSEVLFYADFFGPSVTGISPKFFGSSLKVLRYSRNK